MNKRLKILGVTSLFFLGCGGSSTSLKDAVDDAGGIVVETGSSAAGTGGSTASAAAGGASESGGRSSTATGGSSSGTGSAGSKTGGAGGTSASVSSLAGGTSVSSGGSSKTGGASGGTSSTAASSAGGSSATGGTSTLSTGTGSLAGSSVGGTMGTGGASASAGATATTTFPARFVGNIDTRGTIRTDFTSYWDQYTPENAGKWGSVQASSADTFNWGTLDALYATCEERKIVFKEHTFVWGAAQPSWMSQLDTTTGPAAVKKWMKSFCERYPNTRLIDVVNEPPPHTTPPMVRAIGDGNRTTWDWIANSFKWAREACPNAVLILNDYDNIELDASVQNTIDIVTAIKKLDAPIDAIGCETHSADKLPASTLKANIDKIVAATGLPVYITEYDISLSNDEQQKAQYQDHFPMFWDHPSVKGVTVWGYIAGATFRGSAGLMSSDGTKRPAMTWLMDFLKR